VFLIITLLLLAFISKKTYNELQTLVLISSHVGILSRKEPGIFMDTAGVIRTILFVDIVAMALLALIYLRQRRMRWVSFCYWVLLAVGIPVLGPFLVIANRPGEWNPSFSYSADVRQFISWARRLLPEKPPARKLGTLDRARQRRLRKQR
jgi:hypothetical protein